MKPPIDTRTYCYVEYPSAVFSLERHEIFPYERFAYIVLRIGVEALNHRNLPGQMHVSFSDGADGSHWWAFNARIRPIIEPSGLQAVGFKVSTTPMAPLMLFGMSHYAAKSLLNLGEDYNRDETVSNLRSFVQDFSSHFTQALEVYRSQGLASSIRKLFDLSGIQVLGLDECGCTYTLLVEFIANHEVAHAYVGQLTSSSGHHSSTDQRAFELIVDILATEWIYRHWVVNTPDTDVYRRFRGTSSYEDSIFQNAILVLKGQIMTFLVFAFAGTLVNKGRVVLDGGVMHPHALLRCMFQHVHFMTLLQSNFADILSKKQFHQLDEYYRFFISIFAETGFFNADDAKVLTDTQTAEDFCRAYELIEEYGIKELEKSQQMFQFAASLRGKMRSGRGVSLL